MFKFSLEQLSSQSSKRSKEHRLEASATAAGTDAKLRTAWRAGWIEHSLVLQSCEHERFVQEIRNPSHATYACKAKVASGA